MFHPSKGVMGPPGDEASVRPATCWIIHDGTGQCAWLCVTIRERERERERDFVGVSGWSVHVVAWLCFRSTPSRLQLCIVCVCVGILLCIEYTGSCVSESDGWPAVSLLVSVQAARRHEQRGSNPFVLDYQNSPTSVLNVLNYLVLLLLNGSTLGEFFLGSITCLHQTSLPHEAQRSAARTGWQTCASVYSENWIFPHGPQISFYITIYTAQYHKSQICLWGGLYNLYSIRHLLSLDPQFRGNQNNGGT